MHYSGRRSRHRPLGVRQRRLRQHRQPGADPAAGRRRPAARRPADHRAERRTASCSSPAASSPVLVRANFDDARIWGSSTALDWRSAAGWSVATAFTYLHAADTATGLRAEHRGRHAGARRLPEAALRSTRAAGSGSSRTCTPPAQQDRLSTLDLEDRRTGAHPHAQRASRTSSSTARRRAAGSAPGADGIAGTADDVLTATGETLAQIQDAGARRGRRLRAALHVGARLRDRRRAGRPAARQRGTSWSSTSRTSAIGTTAASRGAWTPRAAASRSPTETRF